jgi:hypothetical protein
LGTSFLKIISNLYSQGDARRLLSYWDPALGVPLEERSYATHCEIWTPGDPVSEFRHIYDALFDGEVREKKLSLCFKNILTYYFCSRATWILSFCVMFSVGCAK